VGNDRRSRKWIAANGPLNTEARSAIEEKIARLQRLPLISVIMPVYNVDEVWLRKCIDSVRDQIYQNWELCIADDHSPKPHIRPILEEYSELDERIKVVFRETNGNISAASNSALEIASGEFCVLLDHDDELKADALFWVANEICGHPDVAMIYSDEDKIDDCGRRNELLFKPDFSRDLLYSLNLVTHLSAYRTDIFRSIGGFRTGFEGSQDYDLALRFIEQIAEEQIRHIPRILYHWRAIPGSVALSGDEKPYAHDRARLAIGEHLTRCGVGAEVEATHFSLHRVRYKLPDKLPSVSLIVNGVESRSDDDWIRSADGFGVEVIAVSQAGRFVSSLNDAVGDSRGEVIIFVDAALNPPDDWVRELVSIALQPGIGAVGAKMIDSNERVIDGGLVFGGRRLNNVAHFGYQRSEPGNMGRNLVIGNYSAVSLSCLAMRRAEFESIGGFAREVGGRFAGADLCLRMSAAGKRIVHDPFVEMRLPMGRSLARLSKPTKAEQRLFEGRWKSIIDCDPFYNLNLDRRSGSFQIDI
jgi:glycosyltransferase involved in cell wall biosynthesis